jgi:hypothetical protein
VAQHVSEKHLLRKLLIIARLSSDRKLAPSCRHDTTPRAPGYPPHPKRAQSRMSPILSPVDNKKLEMYFTKFAKLSPKKHSFTFSPFYNKQITFT